MNMRKRSVSSSRWLTEHFKDKFVKQAHKKKLRSRAWFKLEELQQRYKLFAPGMVVVDLGAAPGGWSQFAASIVGQGRGGRVIACDRLAMSPIVKVDFLQGDFREEVFLDNLIHCIGQDFVQVVMSDMAPNMSGHSEVDMPRAMYLAELALQMCSSVLAPGGSFVVKVFHSRGFDDYFKSVKEMFKSVYIRKPEASRVRSREIYIVAMGKR